MGQHWVDRAYLAAWCDPDCPEGHEPFVWVFDGNSQTGKARSPKKLFKESHIYTDDTASDPLHLEKTLKLVLDEFLRVRDQKVYRMQPLNAEDRGWLCIFAAAKFSRSTKSRDHTRQTWGHMAEIVMDIAAADGATRTPSQIPVTLQSQDGTEHKISLSHLQEIAARPLQRTLTSTTIRLGKCLAEIPMGILCTAPSSGFITSDAPVVIFNPTARFPELDHPDTEVTLPLSPHHCAMWTRHFADIGNGFHADLELEQVDRLNRRTRAYRRAQFVAQKSAMKDEWLMAAEKDNKSPLFP
jgi:hypothetical protein